MAAKASLELASLIEFASRIVVISQSGIHTSIKQLRLRSPLPYSKSPMFMAHSRVLLFPFVPLVSS